MKNRTKLPFSYRPFQLYYYIHKNIVYTKPVYVIVNYTRTDNIFNIYDAAARRRRREHHFSISAQHPKQFGAIRFACVVVLCSALLCSV